MIVNWDLLKHPLNWIIVTLMLIIAGAAGHLLLTHFGATCAGPGENVQYHPAVPDRNEIALNALG